MATAPIIAMMGRAQSPGSSGCPVVPLPYMSDARTTLPSSSKLKSLWWRANAAGCERARDLNAFAPYSESMAFLDASNAAYDHTPDCVPKAAYLEA